MGLLTPINTNIITSLINYINNYVKNIIASTTVYGLIKLSTQSDVNTGTDNTKAVTPLTLKKKFLDTSNAATGDIVVTLNTINGLATFTTVVGGTSVVAYTVLNSNITATSIVSYSLKCENTINTRVSVLSYVTSSGVLVFYIHNSGTVSSGTFSVFFTILS